MQVTKEGIELSRVELGALLAFAGNENIPNVRFDVRRPGAKLRAHATDGHRMIVGYAHEDSPEGVVGEWMVPAEHLAACKRAVGSGEVCVLQIKRGHIGRAVLRNVESGQASSTIVFPENASTQLNFPNVDDIKINKNLSGRWFAIQGAFLRDFGHVSKAVGNHPITLYPPKDENVDPVAFESRGDAVTWEGVVMPVKVTAPGEEAEDYDEEEPDRLNPDLDKAVEELHAVAEEAGGKAKVTALKPRKKKGKG